MTELPLEIDCATVAAMLRGQQDFVLVDCREPDEHAIVSIEGARLVPMSQLQQRIAELEPLREAQIAVHCHRGGRSLKVTQWLRACGFAKVQSMAGGIDQWALEIEPGMARY